MPITFRSRKVAILVGICDIEESKRADVPADIPFYSSLEQLLVAGGADVICICTPNNLHAPQSVRALQAGCHVVVEENQWPFPWPNVMP